MHYQSICVHLHLANTQHDALLTFPLFLFLFSFSFPAPS